MTILDGAAIDAYARASGELVFAGRVTSRSPVTSNRREWACLFTSDGVRTARSESLADLLLLGLRGPRRAHVGNASSGFRTTVVVDVLTSTEFGRVRRQDIEARYR